MSLSSDVISCSVTCTNAVTLSGMSGLRTVIRDEMHDYFSTTISGIMNQVMSARPRTGASVSGNVIMSESDHPRAGAPGIFNFFHRGRTADSSSSEGAKGGQLSASRPRTSSAWMTGTPQRSKTAESVAPPDIEIGAQVFEPDSVLMPRKIEDTEKLSLTFICGGLSHNSPLRLMCFSIWISDGWNAFFFLVTMISCFWSVISSEVKYFQDPKRCKR